MDTRVPAVCFRAARASRGSSWRPCQRPARHIPLRFAGELLSSYARGREVLQLPYCASSRRMNEIGVAPVSWLSMRVMRASCTVPLSILSHPWTIIQVELPIHHVEDRYVGLDVLQECIARLDPGQYNEDVCTGTPTLSIHHLTAANAVNGLMDTDNCHCSITLRTLLGCFQSGDLSHSSFCAPVMQRKYCSPKSDRDEPIRTYQPYRMMSNRCGHRPRPNVRPRTAQSGSHSAKWVS